MRTVHLGKVANIRNGFAFPSDAFRETGVPVIRMSDLDGSEVNTKLAAKVDEDYFRNLPDFRISKGSLLIGMSGSVGKLAVYTNSEPALQNQRVGLFQIIDHEALHFDYLRFFASTLESKIAKLVKGVAIKNLSANDIESIEIPLPSLSEQKRISGMLAEADRLRRTRRYALELSNTFLPAAFLEMFGDLHINKKNWIFAKLADCAEIVSGIAKGQHYGKRKTVNVPYLRVANVQDGYLDLSEIKRIHALPEDVKSLRLETEDIVMTEGGDFDKLGRGAIWPGGIPDCIHQNHIFRVRLDQGTILPQFFSAFLRCTFAKNYFLRCSKQTTNLASINMTQLRATPLPVPPLNVQKRFVALVAQDEHLRAKQRESLRQAEHIFLSLLNMVFV